MKKKRLLCLDQPIKLLRSGALSAFLPLNALTTVLSPRKVATTFSHYNTKIIQTNHNSTLTLRLFKRNLIKTSKIRGVCPVFTIKLLKFPNSNLTTLSLIKIQDKDKNQLVLQEIISKENIKISVFHRLRESLQTRQ